MSGAGWPGLRLPTIASEIGRFIIGDGHKQGYIFSHPKLGYYFFEKLTDQEREEWQQRFLNFGQRALDALSSGKLDPHKAPHYAVRYYGAHLQRAGAEAERSYALVNAGWQRAWEALEGTYDGFLNDLERAWEQAENAGASRQNTTDRGRVIGLQCRYALIVASIKSLVGNIPPALLAALVDKSVWTPVQGLAYAQQMPEEKQRAEALVKLASYLPGPLLQEVLAVSQVIKDAEYRARALTGLVPYVPESLRVTALQEALAASASHQGGFVPSTGADGELAPQLPEPLLQEALAAARAIKEEQFRADVLRGLALQLSEPLRMTALQEALIAARTIKEERGRADMLTKLALQLSEPLRETALQEALIAARTIKYGLGRADMLTKLALQLSEPLRETALQEALAAVRAIEEEQLRAVGLTELAPYLSEPLLQEALAAARAIGSGEYLVKVLTALVLLHLSESLLRQVLAAARAIKEEVYRAEMLTKLAPQLSESLLQEALAAAQTIKEEKDRVHALTGLTPYLPEPLRVTALRRHWQQCKPSGMGGAERMC